MFKLAATWKGYGTVIEESEGPEEDKVVGRSPCAFPKSRSCFTSQICLYGEVTGFLDEQRDEDVIYPDFTKVFDIVSHDVLVRKLRTRRLAESTVRWTPSWWLHRVQSVALVSSEHNWTELPCWVVLGIVLFSILINAVEVGAEQRH